jgi:hypothetical protein
VHELVQVPRRRGDLSCSKAPFYGNSCASQITLTSDPGGRSSNQHTNCKGIPPVCFITWNETCTQGASTPRLQLLLLRRPGIRVLRRLQGPVSVGWERGGLDQGASRTMLVSCPSP